MMHGRKNIKLSITSSLVLRELIQNSDLTMFRDGDTAACFGRSNPFLFPLPSFIPLPCLLELIEDRHLNTFHHLH